MLGFVYRTRSDVDLEGELSIGGIQRSIINKITSKLNKIEVDWDYPETYTIDLKYDITGNLTFVMDLDYERWNQFSDERIAVEGGPRPIIQHVDLDWKDTWHAGAGMFYWFDEGQQFISTGLAYDSSPVDDNDRTVYLPLDEQVKFGMSYGNNPEQGNISYALGFSIMWMGDGKIDQTAQGVRFKGEFDTNYVLFLGGSLRYTF